MTPYAALGLSLLSVLVTVILALAFSSRKCKFMADEGHATIKRTVEIQPGLSTPGHRKQFDTSALRQKNSPVFLTPLQIRHVNIIRRSRGKSMFNRTGLKNAIAHPWDRADVRQPQTPNDWITYLLMYEILFADHRGHAASGCGGGVTINPDQPYNGQGGEYGGAGASGSWDAAPLRSMATDGGLISGPDPYAVVAAGIAASVATPDLILRDGEASSFQDVGTGQIIDQRSELERADRLDLPDTRAAALDAVNDGQTYSGPDPSPNVSDSTPSNTSSDSGGGGGGGGGD